MPDQAPKEPRRTPVAGALPADRRTWAILALSVIVPVTVVVGLYRLEVPLGCPGRFVYPYTPVIELRLVAVPAGMIIAVLAGAGIWLAGSDRRGRRLAGLSLAVLAGVAMACWSYFALPAQYNQHLFNAHSPSHDGAFVSEALKIGRVRDYLADFPQRARLSQEVLRGTRVISNPPGATLVAVGVDRVLRLCPSLAEWVTAPLRPHHPDPSVKHSTAVGIVFFWVLVALWVAAGPLLYAVGRLFLPPAAAASFALCAAISPATVLLSPGKDPAQLLTVAAPLLLWLIAWLRDRPLFAVAAGAAAVLATLASLVHVWIAAIVLAATLWATRGGGAALRRAVLRLVLPAAAGGLVVAVGLRVGCGYDLLGSSQAVAESQAEVTRGAQAMPLAWQLLGVPLFLLFAGPAVWMGAACILLRRGPLGSAGVSGSASAVGGPASLPSPNPSSPRRVCDLKGRGAADGAFREVAGASDAGLGARFGRRLTILAVAVMLLTAGFTNLETPRLWIPFAPLLLLGGFLQPPTLRRTAGLTRWLLAALVAAQLAAGVAQWTVMDMRGAENRLVDEKYFH